jgi:hypothetical protein
MWDPSSHMREEMVERWDWENEKENIPFKIGILRYFKDFNY